MRVLRAKNVITYQLVLRAYVLMCQRALRAYVLMCQRDLRTHVSTWLESLASDGLCDHVITCQHALPSQLVILMPFFSVSLSLLLKLYTLLVRFFESLIDVFSQ